MIINCNKKVFLFLRTV